MITFIILYIRQADQLLQWTNALNFESYQDNWLGLATSIPASNNPSNPNVPSNPMSLRGSEMSLTDSNNPNNLGSGVGVGGTSRAGSGLGLQDLGLSGSNGYNPVNPYLTQATDAAVPTGMCINKIDTYTHVIR